MSKANPKVDWYFEKESRWTKESDELRKILLSCGLDEELKWGKPGYTTGGSNVVVLQGFKDYCALLFVKGVLLKDPKKIMIQQTEHVQGARQLRFTDVREIVKLKTTIKAYVDEAIAVEKSGTKVPYAKGAPLKYPEEFQSILDKDAALRKAFEALTPGRQRGYNLYFSAAKQSATRTARVEKYTKQILAGKGMDD